jgi:wyosine [tRNA(Phe)-imidazoG37] synthetase (radical SAM superfamily)
MAEIRRAISQADIVMPSLDAGGNQIFRYVNRPHPDITFSNMLDGLVRFRDKYKGKYWLEVFLLGGVTTIESLVNILSHCIKIISPDKVQINTVTRPPAEDYAITVPPNQLKTIAAQIYRNAEVIADYRDDSEPRQFNAHCDDVLALLKRRPCCVEDIVSGLGLHRNEVAKCLGQLSVQSEIEAKLQNSRLYYRVVDSLNVVTARRKRTEGRRI